MGDVDLNSDPCSCLSSLCPKPLVSPPRWSLLLHPPLQKRSHVMLSVSAEQLQRFKELLGGGGPQPPAALATWGQLKSARQWGGGPSADRVLPGRRAWEVALVTSSPR